MEHFKKEQKEIKKYILRKIALDDVELIAKSADNFNVPVSVVKAYIQEFLAGEMIGESADRKCRYHLVQHVHSVTVDLAERLWEEDKIFQLYIAEHLQAICEEPALRIWQYG